MNTKEQILSLWNQVNHPGIPELCAWLESSDFFTAPASSNHHLAVKGGLAEHSLNVYCLLKAKRDYLFDNLEICDIPSQALIITALGHDLCKVNYYKEGGEQCSDAQFRFLDSLTCEHCCDEDISPEFVNKFLDTDGNLIREITKNQASVLIDWLKNGDISKMPELPLTWSIEDQLPLGHGEKSLSILQDFIKLTDEEKATIRWHMGPCEGMDFSAKKSFEAAREKWPLVTLIYAADLEASQILERE